MSYEYSNIKYPLNMLLILFILTAVTGLQGCLKPALRTAQDTEIVWPAPPEQPRIRFIRSISGPRDMNINGVLPDLLSRFLKGTTEETIAMPYGVESDSSGRIFVVDTYNRSVHVFDPVNNSYHTFPRKGTTLVSPIDLAIETNGNIYISDSKEAVIKLFTENGLKFVREIGRGILGRPAGIALNKRSDELLVVDSMYSEVIRFDLNDYTYKGKIGRGGRETGNFHFPTNVFVTENGDIYVSDSLNFRVQVFSADGSFLSAFGKAGDSPGYFARPKGVAVDSDNNIYVVDSLFDNIQIFNNNGRLLMDFGKPGQKHGEFWLPSGIFIDRNDMIYISDSYNKRIQVFQYIKDSEEVDK